MASDLPPSPPIPPVPAADPKPVTARWVKLLLGASLALNLAVGGMVAGAFLRDGPPGAHGGLRELALGPLSEALDGDDRKALRKAFLQRFPDFRAERSAGRAEFDTLLSALRADPFDPAALDRAIQAIAERNADLLDAGRGLVADRLKAMDAAARAAFADRLEVSLRRGGGKKD